MRDTEYLKELKEELLDLEFVKKKNDLYQFHQSYDLSVVNKPLINSLKQFLVEECCAWLEMATNIKLNKKVSVTCSSYNYSGKCIIFITLLFPLNLSVVNNLIRNSGII